MQQQIPSLLGQAIGGTQGLYGDYKTRVQGNWDEVNSTKRCRKCGGKLKWDAINDTDKCCHCDSPSPPKWDKSGHENTHPSDKRPKPKLSFIAQLEADVKEWLKGYMPEREEDTIKISIADSIVYHPDSFKFEELPLPLPIQKNSEWVYKVWGA